MKLFRKMRKFVALLAIAALLAVLPGPCSLRAYASEAVTYAVKYIPADEEWRYQAYTSAFNDNGPHRELYYLYQVLKDGDLVVVYNDSDSAPALDLGSAHLSNLTVTSLNSLAIISCGDIDDCYLLGGAYCAINADITRAHAYDTVRCNFNKNVKELNLYPSGDLASNINCLGTVERLYASSRTTGDVIYSLYTFQAGALTLEDGTLTTPADKYSKAPASTVKISKANFDYVRYADDNPDVKEAFGLDASALYRHYTTYGIKEGRAAYVKASAAIKASNFDYKRYADENADVKAAFGYDAKALYNHYITYGIKENRGNYSK